MKFHHLFALCVATAVIAAPSLRAGTIVVSLIGPIDSIQAGIDAASAGDTVVVKAGTYFEAPTVGAGKNGLVIKGFGKATIDARGVAGIALGAGLRIASNDVTVLGLTIRNAKEITNNEGDGIRGTGTNLMVKNCTFLDNDDAGVHVIGSAPAITNCRFTGNFMSISLDATDGSVIRGCKCDKEDSNGIRLKDTANTTIENCSFLLIEDGAIISATLGTANNGLTVRKCRFENADSEAAFVVGDDFVFENNKVLHTGGGVDVVGENPIIRKNAFFKMVDDALAITCGGNASTGLIELNVAKDVPDEFISLELTTSNFVVRKNRVTNVCCEDEFAFDVSGDGHVLEDNVAIDVGGDAFHVVGNNNHFSGCIAKNCLRDGFDIQSGTGTVLVNCVARGCIAEGVDNSGTATQLFGGSAKNCRIDFANNGSVTVNGFAFVTGGQAVTPEID